MSGEKAEFKFPWLPGRPAIRQITVVEVEYLTGNGIVGDPQRRVVAYFAPDGTLLAERDSWTLTARTGNWGSKP